MFLTDEDIQTALAGELKVDTFSDLPSWWVNLIAEEHAAAYQEILSEFITRGYTVAQTVGWDQGADTERRLSLWRVLVRAGTSGPEYNPAATDKLNVLREIRREMRAAQLFVGGVYLQAGNPSPGQAMAGPVNTSGGVFRLPCRRSPW